MTQQVSSQTTSEGPRRWHKSDVIVGAMIGAVATVAVPLITGMVFQNKANDPKPVDASSIVLADDLPDTITTDDWGVNVQGRLSGPLPSGTQIWSAARQSPGEDSDGIDGPGFTVTELCDVSEDSTTFNCGLSQLGNDSRPAGRFVVYIGMADSTTARDLLKIRVEQERDDNWAHTVPRGFNALKPQIVTRK